MSKQKMTDEQLVQKIVDWEQKWEQPVELTNQLDEITNGKKPEAIQVKDWTELKFKPSYTAGVPDGEDEIAIRIDRATQPHLDNSYLRTMQAIEDLKNADKRNEKEQAARTKMLEQQIQRELAAIDY